MKGITIETGALNSIGHPYPFLEHELNVPKTKSSKNPFASNFAVLLFIAFNLKLQTYIK